MKKFFAISLLLAHLFNLGGYQLFFSFLENQAFSKIVERLDGGAFSNNELVEVKIPYPLPYAANRTEYERYDGEIEMNGVHYNYVKRKMSNDTLYLLCIPNSIKTDLNSAKTELIAGLSDVNTDHPSGQKSPGNSIVKPFTTEFNHLIAEYRFEDQTAMVSACYFIQVSELLDTFIQSPLQPPRA